MKKKKNCLPHPSLLLLWTYNSVQKIVTHLKGFQNILWTSLIKKKSSPPILPLINDHFLTYVSTSGPCAHIIIQQLYIFCKPKHSNGLLWNVFFYCSQSKLISQYLFIFLIGGSKKKHFTASHWNVWICKIYKTAVQIEF